MNPGALRVSAVAVMNLSACRASLEGGAGKLLFATNAGMFDSNLKPVGLYVEQGRELVHDTPSS